MGRNTQPHPVDVHVGAKIRLRRKELACSQERLGEAAGVTFQQIQKYERGANRVSASVLVRIAAALEATGGYFLDDAPGAAAAPPPSDDWDAARAMLAQPQAMEGLRCLAAMSTPLRTAMVQMMQAATHRLPQVRAA